ncbi:uncharacterized protein LOC116352628 [Contarinia nasturtii]|uniref:uncharacterized protein LOC116352628 n=1 Tax=Contarinia nasturtii TaxID=265458 RepID=UPI0012D416BD|nr:uncharacterized protein LOC116352628 [Contarinia nasturtii]
MCSSKLFIIISFFVYSNCLPPERISDNNEMRNKNYILQVDQKVFQHHAMSCGPTVTAAVLQHFGGNAQLACENDLISDVETAFVDDPTLFRAGSGIGNVLDILNLYIRAYELNSQRFYQSVEITSVVDYLFFSRLVYNSLINNSPVLLAFDGQLTENSPRIAHFILIHGITTDDDSATFYYMDPDGGTLGYFTNANFRHMFQGTSYLLFHSRNTEAPNQPQPQAWPWVNVSPEHFQDEVENLCDNFFASVSLHSRHFLRKKRHDAGTNNAFEIQRGHWRDFYRILFPYTVAGRWFMYGQNIAKKGEKNWFIQEIRHDGTLGDETVHGNWNKIYEVQFPFSIGGRTFFYGQTKNGNNYFIQELKADGTMGDETCYSNWNEFYQVQFPFSIDNRHYLYGQSIVNGRNWFIQELKADGTIGKETAHDFLDANYEIQCPFSVNGKQFFYGQSLRNDRKYFIKELLAGGKVGSVVGQGSWKYNSDHYDDVLSSHSSLFQYSIDGVTFSFEQYVNKTWVVRELKH